MGVYGTILAIILIYLLISNFKRIVENIRYWYMIYQLPPAAGKKAFVGHVGGIFGKTIEQAWYLTRRQTKNSPPIFTFFMGPTLAFVCIQSPKELEALMGSMKNLQKSRGYEFIHRWLGEGLLTSEGEKWQKRRKILTPAFHFSILLEFVDIFNRETQNFITDIENNHLDKEVDVVPLISNFTLLTISETSMGTKLNLDTQEGIKYKDAICKMGDITFKRITAPWLWYQIIFDRTKLRKIEADALEILHGFANKIIKKRTDDFKVFDEKFDDTYTKRKHPLLDVLLNAQFKKDSINKQEIREEVDTFMFEGHDTTAMCLNYTVMLFGCHQDYQEQVYQEIVSIIGSDLTRDPTYNELQQMQLLERFIKESLRLYPPVPLIGRKLSEDLPTSYGTIPRGAYTFTHLYDLHRNSKYWPDPDKFDPSRFLPENSRERHPFAYIPFSAGPRNCIGQRFAMLELKAFFCGLLRKFVVHPVDIPETLVLVQDLVLRARKGVKAKFTLREL